MDATVRVRQAQQRNRSTKPYIDPKDIIKPDIIRYPVQMKLKGTFFLVEDCTAHIPLHNKYKNRTEYIRDNFVNKKDPCFVSPKLVRDNLAVGVQMPRWMVEMAEIKEKLALNSNCSPEDITINYSAASY